MVSNRLIAHTLFSVLLIFAASAASHGQRTSREPRELFDVMPSAVILQVTALGSRVQIPGKEQTVFAGQFVDATGNRSVRVTYQLPGLVRLEGFQGRPSGCVIRWPTCVRPGDSNR
jgi:hypothetical protein